MSLHACFFYAGANLVRGDRLRSFVAVAGAAVAIFILMLHTAFLRAVEEKSTQVYRLFDADIVMLSDRFQFLYRTGDFPAARLRQALSLPEIESAAAVRIASSHWFSGDTRRAQSTLLLIGIDRDLSVIADPQVRGLAEKLGVSREILFDRLAEPDVGIVRVGDTGFIGRQPATVVGLYDLGLPMYAATTAIVANTDFPMYSGGDPNRIQLGLLRLARGADTAGVINTLKAVLPNDVRVMTRADLISQEAAYFIDVKPLGIMMRAGMLIGLLVGAVALFQVMSSQMEARMHDFAVLRATGFSARFTYAVGAVQLFLIGAVAFAAAWIAAMPLFALIAKKSYLSLPIDVTLLSAVVLLCLPMIASAGLPLLRAAKADPARLFLNA